METVETLMFYSDSGDHDDHVDHQSVWSFFVGCIWWLEVRVLVLVGSSFG